MFSLPRKIAFTSNIILHKWETCFHYSEKYFLQAKICPYTNKKYVYTISKTGFTGKTLCFQKNILCLFCWEK